MSYHLTPNSRSLYSPIFFKSDVSNPITECGLVLSSMLYLQKENERADHHRYHFHVKCKDLQDAVIKCVNPQMTCIDLVRDRVREVFEREGQNPKEIEFQLKHLSVTFESFWWETVK